MVTIKDIANMANVSRGTVDRVLNNRGGVNPQTAERIRLIAEKMNYTPSITGRSLAVTKKDLKIGFILTDKLGKNSALSRALERKTKQFAEYCVMVNSRIYTEGDASSLLNAIESLVQDGTSGIALSPVINNSEIENCIDSLSEKGIAVVTYDHDLPNSQRLAFVGCDYYRNGQTIAGLSRLILNGTGKVGILSGKLTMGAHPQRIKGIEACFAQKSPNISITEETVCDEDDVSTYSAAKQMLEMHTDIDLVVLNVAGAYGLVRAIRENTKKVHVITTNRISDVEQYLQDGVIDAAVTHQPWMQTNFSMDILFQYLVWGRKPDQTVYYTNDEIRIAENSKLRRMEL